MTSKRDKNKLERLSKTIFPMQLLEDKGGKYLGYCSYRHHTGVVGTEKAKTCERKDCWHYVKFRGNL